MAAGQVKDGAPKKFARGFPHWHAGSEDRTVFQEVGFMMYLWLIPLLLFVLLLVLLFVRKVNRTGGDYGSARDRADILRHGDEDPD